MPAGHLHVDTLEAVRCLALTSRDLSVSEDLGVDGVLLGKGRAEKEGDCRPVGVCPSQS